MKRQSTESIENLRTVGKRYNELCDLIDQAKNDKKSQKDKSEKIKFDKKIQGLRQELKDYKSSLTKEELEAYSDYKKIRLDIKYCELRRKGDKIERKIFKKLNPAYIYMIPAAFGALFFTLCPALFMIIGAFFKVDLVDLGSSYFVGFKNFIMIFTRDIEIQKALGNTALFAFITIILLMAITVLMASWLQKNTKINNFVQTLIFTPHISSMVAVAILWVLMLDPIGIINQILAVFGIKGPSWLLDPRTSLISVAIVSVWKSIGYYTLIIIAGLQSLPSDVYEAAKLDKAGRFTTLRKITLPLLAPTLSFVFVMKFINSFKSFAAIDVMTQGGPQGSSIVLGYWIYTVGRVNSNYGQAMAGAIVMTIMVAFFTIISNKAFKDKG